MSQSPKQPSLLVPSQLPSSKRRSGYASLWLFPDLHRKLCGDFSNLHAKANFHTMMILPLHKPLNLQTMPWMSVAIILVNVVIYFGWQVPADE